MSGFIIFTLAVLGILVLLGGAFMFMYFSGLAGGAVMNRIMRANGYHAPSQSDAAETSQQRLRDMAEAERIDALLRDFDRVTHSK
ncbi:hypothetical protein [Comamonas sp. JNW]|uniref:hypothetical protein n=1 Tax=Comamonas sp. JNW TaxID=2170731 RepID=UPI001057D514|nr:hypothetical protein [Comamonas sp. JNW]